jgi:hypothetical protein
MKFLLDVIAYSIFCHFSVKFEAGGDTLRDSNYNGVVIYKKARCMHEMHEFRS